MGPVTRLVTASHWPLVRPAFFLMSSSVHEASVLCAGGFTKLEMPKGMSLENIKGRRG